MVIFNKINTYLDTIQSKIETYEDKTLLMLKLKEADEAINQFEKQRVQNHYGYNDGHLVLRLRKRAVAIRKSIQKALLGQSEEANKGKKYRADLERFLQQLRQTRKRSPRIYTPENGNGNNLPPAPMRKNNKFNRNQFNTMIHALEQQKAAQNASAQNALISPSQKGILHAL
jgi:hypothetical protein